MYQESAGGLLVALLLALIAQPALAGEPVRGATPVRVDPTTPGQVPYGVPPGYQVLPPREDPLQWHPRPNVLRGARPGDVELVLDVPPGFVVYRDQLHVEVVDRADLHVGHPDIPPGEVRMDPGRDEIPREQYSNDIIVRIPAQAARPEPGVRTLQIKVRHQGCFEGHCYRPKEQIMDVHVPVRAEDEVVPELDRRGLPVEREEAETEKDGS